MSGVFKILIPHPHPPPLPGECVPPPPPLVRGEDTLAGRRGGGGSIVWKTLDCTALYSIYLLVPLSLYRTVPLLSYLPGGGPPPPPPRRGGGRLQSR
jgi:hypothetical protein